ncbi:MAG: hypothetical protein WCI11_13090 [Candidatus Methylumidiphilus sp.]
MTIYLILSTILLIIIGVLVSFFLDQPFQWIGLLVGLSCIIGPIVWYYYKLLNKLKHEGSLSDTDIDSIYYFGFLITLITLAVTIVIVGVYSDIISGHLTKIIPQFGFGLLATGVALLCRLDLLSKEEFNRKQGPNQAAERQIQNIEEISSRFDTLSLKISDLANNTQTRSLSLLSTFDFVETQFQERLNKAVELFDHLIQTSGGKLKQAKNELETANKNVQVREKRLELEFNGAITKFNEHLTQAAQDSLGKTTAVIEQSIQKFAESVVGLSDEIGRLQKDVKTLNFNHAAKQIGAFAKAMETSLGSIQSAVEITSQNAAEAINKLTAAAKDVQAIAVGIAENLDSLKNLDQLVAQIDRAGVGLWKLSDYAAQSGDSLLGLGGSAREAATASGHLSQNVEGASISFAQLAGSNHKAIEAIAKLAEIANDTHAIAVKITENLNSLKNLDPLVAQISHATESLEKLFSGATQSSLSLAGMGKNVHALSTASSELTKNLLSTSSALVKFADTSKETQGLPVEIVPTTSIPRGVLGTIVLFGKNKR